MIISIGGVPGSGKTSVGHIIGQKLGMPFYSMGGLRAKMAMERGLTIDQLNTLGETDKTTDTYVDDYQRQLGQTEDNFVIEGRLSWHFIPHSFKIFLTCESHEAARRVYSARHSTDERHDEPSYETIEHAREELEKRMTSDHLRYQKHYNLDYQDPANYTLVIDTTKMTGAEQTAEAILTRLKV